jgi:hypothetical protein
MDKIYSAATSTFTKCRAIIIGGFIWDVMRSVCHDHMLIGQESGSAWCYILIGEEVMVVSAMYGMPRGLSVMCLSKRADLLGVGFMCRTYICHPSLYMLGVGFMCRTYIWYMLLGQRGGQRGHGSFGCVFFFTYMLLGQRKR